jgi:hypothetical protein
MCPPLQKINSPLHWLQATSSPLIFWDDGALLVDVLDCGTIINCDWYSSAPMKLKQRIKGKHSQASGFIFLHGSVCLHVFLQSLNSLAVLLVSIVWCWSAVMWACQFGPLKNHLAGCWFLSDFGFMQAKRALFLAQGTHFLQYGVNKLVCWCPSVHRDMLKIDNNVNYNLECAVCWFDAAAVWSESRM